MKHLVHLHKTSSDQISWSVDLEFPIHRGEDGIEVFFFHETSVGLLFCWDCSRKQMLPIIETKFPNNNIDRSGAKAWNWPWTNRPCATEQCCSCNHIVSQSKQKQTSPSLIPASQRSGFHSASTITSSWVLRLSETKVLKFYPPPKTILFCYFPSLNQTGSGRRGASFSLTVINCLILRLRFPGDLDLCCKEPPQHLELVLQSFTLWELVPNPERRRASERASVRGRARGTTCVLVVSAIIHHDNLDTSNEQHGRRVGAEAGSLS